jgi:hypothetical protein
VACGEPAVTTIGILGGTGPQGRGLGRRFARAGHRVLLGSRSAERAARTAQAYAEEGQVDGVTNAEAAGGEMVIAAVPYQGQADLLRDLADRLAGKVLVNCVNPLGFDRQGPYVLPVAAGSAAEEAQGLVPDATVIGAFHHVSAVRLDDPAVTAFDEDVLVLGDDRDAVSRVCDLAAEALPGARGVYAGRLRLAERALRECRRGKGGPVPQTCGEQSFARDDQR